MQDESNDAILLILAQSPGGFTLVSGSARAVPADENGRTVRGEAQMAGKNPSKSAGWATSTSLVLDRWCRKARTAAAHWKVRSKHFHRAMPLVDAIT